MANAPQRPSDCVRRSRLHEVITRGVECGAVLVAAPAGYGKTTLGAQWAADYPGSVSWLTLEPRDDAPAALCARMLSALGQPLSAADPEPAVVELLNRLSRTGQRSVLVLDDLHVLTDPRALELLGFVVAHAAPVLSVVMLSRCEPRLPRLACWRGRGGVTDLRAHDLQATDGEASAFVAAAAPDLDGGTAAGMVARARGWFAALRLELEAARGPERTAALGAVRRYLIEEVLEQAPAELAAALATVAVVDGFDLGLGGVLLADEPRPAATLRALADAGLLSASAHDGRAWFRHLEPLRREVLVRLERRDPARVRLLHLRTAAWYAAHEQPLAAARHYVAGGDLVAAERVVLARLVHHLHGAGDRATARVLLVEAPAALAKRSARLRVLAAWMHAGDGDLAEAARIAREVGAEVDTPGLRRLCGLLAGDPEVPPPVPSDPDEWWWEAMALALDPGADTGDCVRRCAAEGANRLAAEVLRCAANYWLARGRPSTALRHVYAAALLRDLPADASAALQLARARAFCEQGELAPALAAAREALVHAAGDRRLTAVAHLELARVHLYSGDLVAARAALGQVDRSAFGNGLRFALPPSALAEVVGRLLEPDVAAQWLDRTRPDPLAALELRLGTPEAGAQLRAMLAELPAESALSIDATALLAMAELQAGDHAAALLTLRNILPAAERTGHVRPLLRPELRDLLEALGGTGRTLAAKLAGGPAAGAQPVRRPALELVGVPLVMLGGAGEVQAANAAAQTVLGTSKATSLEALFGSAGAAAVTRAAQRCREGRHPVAPGENLQARPSGRWLRVTAVPLDGGDRVMLTLLDVTGAKLAEQALGQVRRLLVGEDAAPAPDEPAMPDDGGPLSSREIDILRLIGQGYANKDIAQKLYLSLSTVKAHASSLYRKLDVSSRTQALERARALGIVL